jgi:capsule polysaccharide export protein KpsE/RkpR
MKVVHIRWLTRAAAGLLGASCVAYGCDQHVKRRKEQETYRERLGEIEKLLTAKEDELKALRSALGDKNDQVQLLVAEIEMLREQAAVLRGST